MTQGGHRRTLGRREGMGNAVGIHNGRPQRGEAVSHRRLPAADPAGQPDNERPGAHGLHP